MDKREPIEDFSELLHRIRHDIDGIGAEFSKRIVGNTSTLRFMLKALLSGGHVLLEGVPGLGKTLMVKTIAEILDLQYRRIQFTPDLMPADIVGTNIIVEDDQGGKQFRFERGPVFTQVLLADEVNRASPKTQSALLEAMEERRATVFGKTYEMDDIFFTLATQNPIEMAGTYPLPEAQLDRFFFKLDVSFPSLDELAEIGRTNSGCQIDHLPVEKVLSKDRILEMREILCNLPVTDRIYEFASHLVHLTHPDCSEAGPDVRRFIKYGASPRGLIALIAASRVSAVLSGRVNLSIDDLEENYLASLRHRLVLGFEADLEGIKADNILESIFQKLRRRF